MIARCPVNLACRLDRIVEIDTHEMFIGKIAETYCDEAALSNGKPELHKSRPLMFDMSSRKDWLLGEPIADGWQVGKKLKNRS